MWLCLVLAVGDRYTIDEAAARCTARVSAAGLLSGLGHEHTLAIRAVSGEVRLPGRGLAGGTVRLTFRADSVAEIGDDFDEEERKKIDRDVHAKVLEASKYPTIDFQGTAVSEDRGRLRIDGHLTLHGITRPLTIQAEVGPHGGVLTARGTFKIKHSDFGLERLSAVGGLVKASEEIILTFDLLGRREKIR